MDRQIKIKVGGWPQLASEAGAVRHQVFVVEQNVPIDLELDDQDAVALHAVAMRGEQAVGTGRLLPDAHIGRMAVLPSHRGKGIGARLLAALVEQARRRGDACVVLASQCHAQGFYAPYGFEPEGEEFMDAGIAHIMMRKVL